MEASKKILILPDGTVESDFVHNFVKQNKWDAQMTCCTVSLSNFTRDQTPIDLNASKTTRNYVQFYLSIDDCMAYRQTEHNAVATNLAHKWSDAHHSHNLQICGPALLEIRFSSALKGSKQPHCTNCPLNLEKNHVDLLLYSDASATDVAHSLSYKQCPRHSS